MYQQQELTHEAFHALSRKNMYTHILTHNFN